MKKSVLALALGLCLVTVAVRAAPVPQEALDKDFTACMGGEDPDKDTQRRDYCLCVRDQMKNWTLDEYGEVAAAGAQTQDAKQAPAQLKTIAKTCIDQVLK